MKKRMMLLLAAGIMSVAIAACGKEPEGTLNSGAGDVENVSQATPTATSPAETPAPAKTPAPAGTAAPTEEDKDNKYQVGDIDNFSVDKKTVAEFGKEVKTAVADNDLEALADLAAFPLYVGFKDGGVSVKTREDFIALGSDKIFTKELVDSIAGADENSLSASRAGFSLTSTGAPNIVFGVREGRLTINGMNY